MEKFFAFHQYHNIYGRLLHRHTHKNYMDQSDIKYILELLIDAKSTENWELVDDTIETVKEFLDDGDILDEE